ncbi:MAG: ATP-binding cassette domain-containing protein [Parachlamydiaceae bacterium]|nr:ATP-binding cassette domain-containing protein [Parachlamydiaceae bacterium]
MESPVISVKNICKSYGKLCAVDDLSFEVPANTCFGTLGPNGAGKTTMMKMLYGRSTRDQGTINVFGYDPAHQELAIKYLAGVVSQDNNLDEELNVFDNLKVYSKFYGLSNASSKSRIEDLLNFMDLSEKKYAHIKALSGGMQRRLIIARALLNHPKLLILDEPTIGLDPQVRHHIWDKLRQLKKQGTTILLTTHYMEEAFVLCDRVMIMDKGKAVSEGHPKNLLEQNIEKYVLEINGSKAVEAFNTENISSAIRIDKSDESIRLYSNDSQHLQELASKMEGAHYYLRQANLEDLFLKATGRGLNE